MRRSIVQPLLALVLCAAVTAPLRAGDKPLAAPRPIKDAVASQKHLAGTGVFTITVDRVSGKVKSVGVGISTTNVFLDTDVVNTLLQWKFGPGFTGGKDIGAGESLIILPVAFTADSDTAFYPQYSSNRALNLRRIFTAPITPAKYHELTGL
jgi:outer membrane biosynthesis protein TonB